MKKFGIVLLAIIIVMGQSFTTAYAAENTEAPIEEKYQLLKEENLRLRNEILNLRLQLDGKEAEKIPVLMYHHILKQEDIDKYGFSKNTSIISSEIFEEQMDYLYENGFYTASLDEPQAVFKPSSNQSLSLSEAHKYEDVFDYESHTYALHDLNKKGEKLLLASDKEIIVDDLNKNKELLNAKYIAYPLGFLFYSSKNYFLMFGYFFFNPILSNLSKFCLCPSNNTSILAQRYRVPPDSEPIYVKGEVNPEIIKSK